MRKLAIMVGLLFGGAAFAGGYGMAGCGLGSLVFGDSKGIVQIFAATTNGLFGSQLFGITTGTSNCADSDAAAPKSAKIFIEGNKDALAKDIARGSGDTLAHLSELAGCQDSKAVGTKLQASFKDIFPSEQVSTDQVSQNIMSTLKGDKTLACTNVG